MWVGQRMFVYQFRFILFLDGPNSQETHTKSTARNVALASFVYIFQHFDICFCLLMIFRAFWEPDSLQFMKEETLTVTMICKFSKMSYLRDFEQLRLYFFYYVFESRNNLQTHGNCDGRVDTATDCHHGVWSSNPDSTMCEDPIASLMSLNKTKHTNRDGACVWGLGDG